MIQIQVQGTITLTDDVADVLEHLASYDTLELFEAKYSKRFNKEQMHKTLEPLQKELRQILTAKKAAVAAANEVLKPKQKEKDA